MNRSSVRFYETKRNQLPRQHFKNHHTACQTLNGFRESKSFNRSLLREKIYTKNAKPYTVFKKSRNLSVGLSMRQKKKPATQACINTCSAIISKNAKAYRFFPI